MQIEIKITNPSVDFLAAMMVAHASLNSGVIQEALAHAVQGAEPEAAPAKDEAVPTPKHVPITAEKGLAVGERITTIAEVEQLHPEERVFWKGQKFEFFGRVEDVDTYGLDDDDTDTKILWLRRSDTGKKVSLTLGDIKRGCLTKT